jgi:hypothetical protein
MKIFHNILIEQFKKPFMVSYCAHKDFSFFEETRTHEIYHREVRLKKGQFLTKLQIAQRLGGSDNPEALRQAEVYIKMCETPELKDLLF